MFRFRSACRRVTSLMAALLALPLLAHAAAGDLYVGNQGSNNIERFSPDGTSTLFADSASGVDAPTGLCFDLAGNLFVADTARNAVLKITPGGC